MLKMMKHCVLQVSWMAVVLGLLFAPFSSMRAQVSTADIVGTVTDPSGGVVPGVEITITNLSTQAKFSVVTDDTGRYQFKLLPPGRYRIRAEKAGFKAWTVSEVALAINDRLRQDVRLEVGELEQTVEVRGRSPALQSESSSLGGLITAQAMQDLPLNGRNFVALAQLVAGANDAAGGFATGGSPDDRRRSSAVSVNAQTGGFNNFLIDGMDNNERFINTAIVRPSVEALAEMKVLTNLYSAELGRTAGGVINVITKSGGNEYHGSLFHFFRNEKLDARNFFAGRGPKPPYKQNQFGGSIGGPIKENRTFFFGDYESYRARLAQTFTSTVPTLAMRQGRFEGLNPIFDPLSTRPDPASPGGFVRDRFPNDTIPADRMDPVAVKLLNLYPEPQTTALANNYTRNAVRAQTDDTADIRVDHKISQANTFFARYSINDTRTQLPGALPVAENGIDPVGDAGQSGSGLQRSQSAQLSDVHVFNPQLVLDLKANYSRFSIESLPPNYGKAVSAQLGIPGVNVDQESSGLARINPSGFRGMGDGSFIPLLTTDNVYQLMGSILYVHGAHSLKIGGDLRRRQVAQFQSSQPRADFSFDSNFTNDPSGAVRGGGNSIASLLLGYPSSTSRDRLLVYPGYRFWETAAYVQDDWRVTSRLTLNIGLRYEYFSPNSESANRISNLDLQRGKVLIAGRDGVSKTAGVQKDWLNLAPRFGFAATLSKGTVLRGGYGISFVPPIMGTPYALRNPPFSSGYSVSTTPITPINRLSDGLPYPAPSDPANPSGGLYAVALDFDTAYLHQYNLTLQRELPLSLVGSASYVGVLGRKLSHFSGPNVNRPAPGPGTVQPRRPYYSVFPNLSSINLLHNWSDSSYQGLQTTLERRFQSGFGTLATYTWAHAIDSGSWLMLAARPRRVRGSSDGDIRHRFTVTANYDLPFAKGATGWHAALAKGWRLNAIGVLQTGTPLTIFNAAARSNTGSGDWPSLIADPRLPSSERTLSRWFNTANFQLQPLYEYGNAGRSVLNAPGRITFDTSVHRDFALNERTRLQFRAEAFNVANTPAFGGPGTSFGSTSFGVISSAAPGRNIQLALKLLF